MRTSVVLGLGLSLSLFACTASSVDDELAGEDADGEGKADADGLYTYYHLSSDLYGGVVVDRVNRAGTFCSDGKEQAQCGATDIDWSAAGLGPTEVETVTSALGRVIVRGSFEPTGRLVVTEAWVAQAEAEAEGVFALVKDAGIRCLTSPCESMHEQKLNSALEAMIAGVDFAPSGADEGLVQTAFEQMAMDKDGVIVAGWRDYTSGAGGTARTREAYQLYFRLRGADASY